MWKCLNTESRSYNNVKKENKFKEWLVDNKWKLVVLSVLYQVPIVTIGLVNYPYIDDVSRQVTGITGFADSYSRWGSEIVSWLVQGSKHLTDLGLTTYILTALILTLTSALIVFSINGKLEWLSLIGSVVIGLNPWFLQCISFRFDSPYMALSILVPVIPFLWWRETKKFVVGSIIGIFLMCNFYQPASGVYILIVLALVFRDLMEEEKFGFVLKKAVLSAVSMIIGTGLFYFESLFNPEIANRGGSVAIAKGSEIPITVINNAKMYLETILNQSASVWILFGALVLAVFCLSSFLHSYINPGKKIIYILLYLVLSSVLSYGILLVFSEALASWNPRYAFGFGVFMGIVLIFIGRGEKAKWLSFATKAVSYIFIYYIVSFPFTYASTLNYQLNSFERQSVILSTDLKEIVTQERRIIQVNRLFSESKEYQNSAINFPILTKLVPPNGSTYWPNVILFSTYTNLNVDFFSYDFSSFDSTDKNLEVSNLYYDIYTLDDEIYILMK